MSHDINLLANGEATIAYYTQRGVPWHGLGQPVDGDMPLHVMLEASHSDYTVTLDPVYTQVVLGHDDDGLPIYGNVEVENHWATVRHGGGMEPTGLGVVKSRYAGRDVPRVEHRDRSDRFDFLPLDAAARDQDLFDCISRDVLSQHSGY